MLTSLMGWKLFGLIGQVLFGMRFVVQWFVSEKKRDSVIPLSFWYFSLSGGIVLFLYAIHIQDLVFIIGQGLGLIIYIRNLYLIRKSSRKRIVSKQSEPLNL
ncbi:MAG TPA: lipid-A-disaccharide synthase N-terminal domain-containing protein [Candidatus Nitrosotenuis sp.]|nr:lipid-A-disaccharide synthase N-terminal domain-containing protein [Candidatus Nitrosotenuis sp.]